MIDDVEKLVELLIARTKEGSLEWKRVPAFSRKNLSFKDEKVSDGYYVEFEHRHIVVWTYAVRESSDGDTWWTARYPAIGVFSNTFERLAIFDRQETDQADLWRLLKLVQRRANKIDELISGIIEKLSKGTETE